MSKFARTRRPEAFAPRPSRRVPPRPAQTAPRPKPKIKRDRKRPS